MQNGIELIKAESPGEKPFMVVNTIQDGQVYDSQALKSLKASVDTTGPIKVIEQIDD
jgi:hypothetical protein